MSWATWRAGAPERRLRRQMRRESFVTCEGDTATHWSGFDFDICSRDDCTQPSGGPCIASEESDRIYRNGCMAAGIEP